MNLFYDRTLLSKKALKVVMYVFLGAGAGVLSVQAAPDSREAGVVEIAQQSITITGTVTDNQGDPVIGANVVEKGTTNGTSTDMDGKFRLTVRNAQSVLLVTYIGYANQEEIVGNKTSFNIILQEDAKIMDEVVVIGYGTQRKGDVTSAIVSIKAEDFSVGKISDAADLVKGKIAGLNIVKSSGDPNTSSGMMLRGVNTVIGDVTPLVLVDGIEGSLTTVAPENIESIDVLKDASAAAIYGTRGANGVILITTKTGRRESHSEVSYSGYASFSDWYKTADFMDTNDIIYGLTNFEYDRVNGYDTDWLKAITRKAGYTQNHSLSLRGGSKNSAYSGNVTYSDEEGIMRKSDRNELKTQLDFTQYALNDIVKFNINLLYSRHKHTNNDNAYAYRQALIHNPSSPVYNEDGTYYEEFSRFQYYNPVAIQNERIGDTRTQFARVTGNITVEPIKGWQTNLMLSVKENSSTGQDYYTSNYYSKKTEKIKGTAGKSSSNDKSENLELTSKYDLNVKQHRLTALVGYSYLYNVYDSYYAGNSNFPSESYLYNNMSQGTYLKDPDKVVSLGSSKNDNTLIGFFGRVSYGYDDRYNIMASIRREGSSKFGDNNKWGTFPSVSVGWNAHNEEFMKEFTWLNVAKVRIGQGITGVIPGYSYLSLNIYNYDPYGNHLSQSGTWSPSLMIDQNPNSDLKWQKTQEWNFGIDWSILDNRLGGSIDLYTKKTVDLLDDYAVPVPPNLYETTQANVGKIRNQGIEVMINAVPVRTKDFEYNTTLTLSHNANKLLSLSNNLYETDNFQERYGGLGDPISVPTHYMEVGSSIGNFWGLKSVGVSKDGVVLVEVKDDDDNWVVKEFDTKYNEQGNRQDLGTGLPQLYAGWNHTFIYKGFDLNLQFTGQFGYKILNTQRSFYENNSIAYNRLKSAADWHGAVDTDLNPVIDPETGKQKQVRLSSSMSQGFWSDHLENGDFVKLTNATFGYTFPIKRGSKYIKSARVYVSGQNLFCITGYSGLDPEVSNSVKQDDGSLSFLTPGVDGRDKYPTIRSFTVGVNINF
ncbi:MAG: TonB-dependent receptor [Tannerella sp.]|jgi:TonB-linked SusC/RagA family outer membrane protein|nr:TonB-dependent receptor [Tannerella sp.]